MLAVCTENLNASVMMVESAQDRARSDGADTLNWTPERRVFVQRAVPVVIDELQIRELKRETEPCKYRCDDQQTKH
jgi:hypothetical protein